MRKTVPVSPKAAILLSILILFGVNFVPLLVIHQDQILVSDQVARNPPNTTDTDDVKYPKNYTLTPTPALPNEVLTESRPTPAIAGHDSPSATKSKITFWVSLFFSVFGCAFKLRKAELEHHGEIRTLELAHLTFEMVAGIVITSINNPFF